MMKPLLMSLTLSLCFSACGGFGAANVASCKALYSSLSCGSVNLSSNAVACDAYDSTVCDVSGYFDCVRSHYVCTNGQFDSAKMGTLSECSAKAVCK